MTSILCKVCCVVLRRIKNDEGVNVRPIWQARTGEETAAVGGFMPDWMDLMPLICFYASNPTDVCLLMLHYWGVQRLDSKVA